MKNTLLTLAQVGDSCWCNRLISPVDEELHRQHLLLYCFSYTNIAFCSGLSGRQYCSSRVCPSSLRLNEPSLITLPPDFFTV